MQPMRRTGVCTASTAPANGNRGWTAIAAHIANKHQSGAPIIRLTAAAAANHAARTKTSPPIIIVVVSIT